MEIKNTKQQLAIYIHWPFCKSKCPYCDFNSHVREKIAYKELLNAYLQEIQYYKDLLKNREISSIFIGGGTPSLAKPQFIAKIIEALHCYANNFASNIEITIEANPTSVDIQNICKLRSYGVNRISLGIQSLNPQHLQFLGREHSVAEALKALEIISNSFDNYSFDLIHTLPDQSINQWQNELKKALTFCSKHLSLYQLTIENGTKFAIMHKIGKLKMKNDEESAAFYQTTQEIMHSANMPMYEISNHATPSYECIHNLNYWNYGDYIGIGPGAHGRYIPFNINTEYSNNTTNQNNKRKLMTYTYKIPEKWIEVVQTQGHGIKNKTLLSIEEEKREKLLMGMRTLNGIPTSEIKLMNCNTQNITMLKNLNLLQTHCKNNKEYLSCTKKGFLVLNAILEQIIK